MKALHPNGKVTLSPQVFRLDDRRPVYRRRRTRREMMEDLFFQWVVPAACLMFVAVCWVIIFWSGAAILRIVRGS